MRPDGRSQPTVLMTAVRSSASCVRRLRDRTLTCAPRYSTIEMLNTEISPPRRSARACGAIRSLRDCDAVRLEAVLAERGDLSFEQAAMVRSALQLGKRGQVVIRRRSGKTFASTPARRACSRAGYRVYGAAPRARPPPAERDRRFPRDLDACSTSSPRGTPCRLQPRSSSVVSSTRRACRPPALVRLLEIAERAGCESLLTVRTASSHRSSGRRLWGAGRELGATGSAQIAPGGRVERSALEASAGPCR